mmetsp:Transcript_28735/g.78927  ORF Transcript_28735/g.78927 Transcript_28735/m.78927 type:complete len:456 (+) Transcript_28735:243-1610(+)
MNMSASRQSPSNNNSCGCSTTIACLLLLAALTPSTTIAFVGNNIPSTRTLKTTFQTKKRPLTTRHFFNFDSSSHPPKTTAATEAEGLPAFFSAWRTTNEYEKPSGTRRITKTTGNNEPVTTTGMPDLISFLQPAVSSSAKEETAASTKVSASSSSSTQWSRLSSSFVSSSSSTTTTTTTTTNQSNQNNSISDDDASNNNTAALAVAGIGTLLVAAAALWTQQQAQLLPLDYYYYSIDWDALSSLATTATQNPQAAVQQVLTYVETAGPAGPLVFGVAYCLAEILAIPAVPLTMSAGFLFGVTQGTITVLLAATVAASVSFAIGKTILRGFVEDYLADPENAKYAKIDRAIGEQGFPLLFLVRLTPIFPFALSNYVYGASSISFGDFFFGTLLGFAPGTIGYVYTGMVGQELLLSSGDAQPWYVYAGALGALTVVLKLVTDAATQIVAELQDDDDE